MKLKITTLAAIASLFASVASAQALNCDVLDTASEKSIVSKSIKLTSFAGHTFAALPLGLIEYRDNGFVSVEDDGEFKDYSIVAKSRDGKITIITGSPKADLYFEAEGESVVKQVIAPNLQKESRSALTVTCAIN